MRGFASVNRCSWMKCQKMTRVLCEKKILIEVKFQFYKTVVNPAIIFGS